MEVVTAPSGLNSQGLEPLVSLLGKFISALFSWEGTSPAQEGKIASCCSLNSCMHFLIYPFSVQQAFVEGLLGARH